MSAAFDEARAALYVAPLSDFVAARKALAAQLKAKGDPAGAKLLGALPKPSAHAWIANRLFREGALATAFEEGAASRAAQAALMRGESDQATAKRAQESHRSAVAAAVAGAGSVLEGAEAPTQATLSKVSTLVLAITLRGSFAPYPDGCLAGDVELPSLEELASGLVDAAPRAPITTLLSIHTLPAPTPPSDPADDARRRLAEAREEALAAARAAWQAATEREQRSRADAAAALALVTAAEEAVAAARAALEEREREARSANDALALATAARDARHRELEGAERTLRALEAETP